MDPTRPHPDDMTREELQESFDRKIAATFRSESSPEEPCEVPAAFSMVEDTSGLETQRVDSAVGVAEAPEEEDEYHLCPKCGGTNYRRSRRRWYEKLMKRPRMARCMKCNHRFPYPR